MMQQYTIAYLNPDHLAGEMMSFSLESSDTQLWSFATRDELLHALERARFDCVITANICDADRLDLECALYDNGYAVPVIRATESSDLPAIVNALRHGHSLWSIAPPGV